MVKSTRGRMQETEFPNYIRKAVFERRKDKPGLCGAASVPPAWPVVVQLFGLDASAWH